MFLSSQASFNTAFLAYCGKGCSIAICFLHIVGKATTWQSVSFTLWEKLGHCRLFIAHCRKGCGIAIFFLHIVRRATTLQYVSYTLQDGPWHCNLSYTLWERLQHCNIKRVVVDKKGYACCISFCWLLSPMAVKSYWIYKTATKLR